MQCCRSTAWARPPDALQSQPLSPTPVPPPLHPVLTPALAHPPVWLRHQGSSLDGKIGPRQIKWRGGARTRKKRKAEAKWKLSGERNVNEVDHFNYSDSKRNSQRGTAELFRPRLSLLRHTMNWDRYVQYAVEKRRSPYLLSILTIHSFGVSLFFL